MRKWTCEVWCSHHTVSCSRLLSVVNDLTATNLKNLESRHGTQRVSPFFHVALHVSSVVDFLVNCHELLQESFHRHHDVLDEEDDGCHCWYCQKGIGANCRSPDSWCRRFSVVNASLKSERSLIGPIVPDLLREIHQFFLHRKYSSCVI